MGGCGEPRILDDFAAVSRGISRTGPRDLGKKNFRWKLWALVIVLQPLSAAASFLQHALATHQCTFWIVLTSQVVY